MATCKLIRVDVRLIHGQIMLYWVKTAGASQILVVDDALSKDEFMTDFFKKAVPAHIKVMIYNVSDTCRLLNENQLMEGDYLILIKEVDTCYRLFQNGFPMNHVQLGNIQNGPKRKTISKGVCLSEAEYSQLDEMNHNNIRVYIQQTPRDSVLEFKSISKKFK